jgi:hypothetical protein
MNANIWSVCQYEDAYLWAYTPDHANPTAESIRDEIERYTGLTLPPFELIDSNMNWITVMVLFGDLSESTYSHEVTF